MNSKKIYYVGLQVQTDAIGYAVSNEQYDLLKFRGKPCWGVHSFPEGELSDERRGFRTARRRLDRRQQRVALIQELFAKEIAKVDPRFFVRIRESGLCRDDAEDSYSLFADENYTDVEYNRQYPTIHHLISELMTSEEPHDVRLIYIAAAWLVAHRGNFLSNVDKNGLNSIKSFENTYREFCEFFKNRGYSYPWASADPEQVGSALRGKTGVTAKEKKLQAALLGSGKPSKVVTEEFPFSEACIIKLLAGGKCKLKDLYGKDEYDEAGSVSLQMDDDKLALVATAIGDDFDLIVALRRVYDWSILVDALGNASCISEAMIKVYEQHKADLALLKRIVSKYCPKRKTEVFRLADGSKDNYAAYSGHAKDKGPKFGKVNYESFGKYISSVLKDIEPDEEDKAAVEDIKARIALGTFLPKQKSPNNRVIPQQLYWYELNEILKKAEKYLPFLIEKDERGLTVSEKMLSVFSFKIPYFVGPLNTASKFSWVVRKPGKIYPWNFTEMVNLDVSEEEFIKRLIGHCTYVPGEYVLPKDSLLYHKFTVLNEINNISINGSRISVELKQKLYNELFLTQKKVTKKKIINYLIAEGAIPKNEPGLVSGIDEEVKANLAPQRVFKALIDAGTLNEKDAELIIERSSCAEDKTRLNKWLTAKYPVLSEDDRKYICSQNFKDFGRLSRRFLCEVIGADRKTGEAYTIMSALWRTQNNLMELLSDNFTFTEELDAIRRDYYAENPQTLADKMNEMYLSNTVKRSVYRALDVVRDVKKAFGTPTKVFVNVLRETREKPKTTPRREQILELYRGCPAKEVAVLKERLASLGNSAENRLQSDRLFLFFMQLGKSMFSGKDIDYDKLESEDYNIDHLYPQAYTKDESVQNNKVLVLTSENKGKDNVYPISEDIQQKMTPFWDKLHKLHLINDEKYKRLTRTTPFSEEEKVAFVNRHLTATSQSAKAVATLLKDAMPGTEIVTCKAPIVTEFRQEFDIWKPRTYNELAPAVDAYLNIVTGNVYNMKFSRKFWNPNQNYSIKTKTVFTRPLVIYGLTVWDGENMLEKVKATAAKMNARYTRYAFFKSGKLFNQPSQAAEGLTPRKKDLPPEKYGGHPSAGIKFFIPVKYTNAKRTDVTIMPVELSYGERFLNDRNFAEAYARKKIEQIQGYPVEAVSFPLGMRPWKINTMLSLDGLRVCVSGTSNHGKAIITQTVTQFASDPKWKYYIKKLERLVDKAAANPAYVYDAKYDKVTREENMELYELYLDKLQNTVYGKRVNAPTDILLEGEDTFEALEPIEQAKTLLNIHQVFTRAAGGCDLRAIGGAEHAASTSSLSSSLTTWSKRYSDVRLIDTSPTGFWESQSENLLNLLK